MKYLHLILIAVGLNLFTCQHPDNAILYYKPISGNSNNFNLLYEFPYNRTFFDAYMKTNDYLFIKGIDIGKDIKYIDLLNINSSKYLFNQNYILAFFEESNLYLLVDNIYKIYNYNGSLLSNINIGVDLSKITNVKKYYIGFSDGIACFVCKYNINNQQISGYIFNLSIYSQHNKIFDIDFKMGKEEIISQFYSGIFKLTEDKFITYVVVKDKDLNEGLYKIVTNIWIYKNGKIEYGGNLNFITMDAFPYIQDIKLYGKFMYIWDGDDELYKFEMSDGMEYYFNESNNEINKIDEDDKVYEIWFKNNSIWLLGDKYVYKYDVGSGNIRKCPEINIGGRIYFIEDLSRGRIYFGNGEEGVIYDENKNEEVGKLYVKMEWTIKNIRYIEDKIIIGVSKEEKENGVRTKIYIYGYK